MRSIRTALGLASVAGLSGCIPYMPPILVPVLLPPLLLDGAIRDLEGGTSLVGVGDLARVSGRGTDALAAEAAAVVPSLRGRVIAWGPTALRVRPKATEAERTALETWIEAETAKARR